MILLAAAVVATRGSGDADSASPATMHSQPVGADDTNQPAALDLSDEDGVDPVVTDLGEESEAEARARARAENRARWEMNHGP